MLQELFQGNLSHVADVRNARIFTHGVEVTGRIDDDKLAIFRLRNNSANPGVVAIELPLGDSAGFWNAGSSARNHRSLDPDWMGRQVASIVNSVPLGCLYDGGGHSLLSFALDETVREVTMKYGVSEEGKSFVVHLVLPEGSATHELAVRSSDGTLNESVPHLASWLASKHADPMNAPGFASEPVYSTWYAYNQRISETKILADVNVAADLGIRTLFIDDGWQNFGNGRGYQGCGDWTADLQKFPDLKGLIETVHQKGMRVVLWVAPLLLGTESADFAELSDLAPAFKPSLNCHIYDPRIAAARKHIVSICVRLIETFDLDGLKIDFLNESMIYASTPTDGDIPDVGQAMQQLLADLNRALELRGLSDLLIEFRHPYVSPAIAPFANVLRADDCPGDAYMNRGAIIDARMLAGGRIVHSDPIMWDPTADPAVSTRQLMNAFFGVPQISMPLSTLDRGHLVTIKAFLGLWKQCSATILEAQLEPSLPIDGYTTVLAQRPGKQTVIGLYAPSVVKYDTQIGEECLIFNVTAEDMVVIDVEGSAPTLVEVFDAAGVKHSTEKQNLTGLIKLKIPRCGWARLTQMTP